MNESMKEKILFWLKARNSSSQIRLEELDWLMSMRPEITEAWIRRVINEAGFDIEPRTNMSPQDFVDAEFDDMVEDMDVDDNPYRRDAQPESSKSTYEVWIDEQIYNAEIALADTKAELNRIAYRAANRWAEDRWDSELIQNLVRAENGGQRTYLKDSQIVALYAEHKEEILASLSDSDLLEVKRLKGQENNYNWRIEDLEDNFEGWTRYFLLVSSSNGHLHTNTHCSSLHTTSSLAWQPQLSNKTWQEIAEEIKKDTIVCSICCPDAPVELKESRDDTVCPGSGKRGVPGKGRQGYAYGNTLVCTECDAEIGVSGNSVVVKKHPKPEFKPLTKAEEKALKQAIVEGDPKAGYKRPNSRGSIQKITDAKAAVTGWVEYNLDDYFGKGELTVLGEYQLDVVALMQIIAEREGKDSSDPRNGLRKKDWKLFDKISQLNEQFISEGKYPRGLEKG